MRDDLPGLARALPVLTLIFALSLGVWGPTSAAAQADSTVVDGILAEVQTDFTHYAPGEPVVISVFAVNTTPDTLTLEFFSGCQANYDIDGEYRWLDRAICSRALTYLHLAPYERRLVQEFIHTPADYELTPGVHQITGIVVGYAEHTVRIMVGDKEPGPFEVVGSVSPSPAPMGAPISFSVTVTNTSDATAGFVVDGCPVQYTLDGMFTPWIDCAEFARRIDLEPGDSFTFDPADTPYLAHDPHLYPMGPGRHFVTLSIRGAGVDRVEFEVLPPSDDFAYLGGRLLHEDGRPVEEGLVYLTRPSVEGLPPALDPPPPTETHVAAVSPQGYFFFAGILPDTYFMRADAFGSTVWYPGTADPSLAQPILLSGGHYRSIDLIFDMVGPPPPPPGLYTITGRVLEATPDSLGTPLAGAAVLAVPTYSALEDSMPMPGADGDVQPPIPYTGRFLAYTDPDGRFAIEVPDGFYHLVAGDLIGHRYQYWNHVTRIQEAEWIWVPDPTMRPTLEPRFDLAPLEGLSLATVGGTVLAYDPVHDGPPEPLEGAVVMAVPVIPSQLADPAPHRTLTGADGAYEMELPADTPYLVSVTADGYFSQHFRHTPDAAAAEWVDVAPGQAVTGVDFVMHPTGPGPGLGVIEGWVFRTDPLLDCLPSQDCVVPAAGAVVRVTAAFPTFAPYEIRTLVDRDGRFRVEGLMAEPGGELSYYVAAELRGYETAYYPGGVSFREAEPLPVYPDQAVDAGRIVMGMGAPPYTGGFLDGRITGPDGSPVADARVRAFLDPENPDGPVVLAQTGPDGWFHMDRLPEGAQLLVAAEAEGFVPAYYPDAHRWRLAGRVTAGGPASFVAPMEMTLYPDWTGGPYLQAGRVRVALETEVEDSTFVPLTAPIMDPQSIALAWHRENLPGAFFYLVNAGTAAPIPPVMAGESTGDNGTVVLTGLRGGAYLAYADRPGYETAWYVNGGGTAVTLMLDDSTPAILADIRLVAVGSMPPPDDRSVEDDGMVRNVTNAPNPFRPRTTIHFDLMESAPVTLQVFDYRGRLVRTLLTDAYRNAGPHEIPWDGNDADARRVSSGVYFYRISTDHETVARKMVVLP